MLTVISYANSSITQYLPKAPHRNPRSDLVDDVPRKRKRNTKYDSVNYAATSQFLRSPFCDLFSAPLPPILNARPFFVRRAQM